MTIHDGIQFGIGFFTVSLAVSVVFFVLGFVGTFLYMKHVS
jgi:hypothetical protein